MAPDPLVVHWAGKANLNEYAYVRGQALRFVDPVGLQGMDYHRPPPIVRAPPPPGTPPATGEIPRPGTIRAPGGSGGGRVIAPGQWKPPAQAPPKAGLPKLIAVGTPFGLMVTAGLAVPGDTSPEQVRRQLEYAQRQKYAEYEADRAMYTPRATNERFVHAEKAIFQQGDEVWEDGWDVTMQLKNSSAQATVHYNRFGEVNFEPHAATDAEGNVIRVAVKVGRSRGADDRSANQQLEELGIARPDGNWTWHHESYDADSGEYTMLLVDSDVHDTFKHKGAYSDASGERAKLKAQK